MESLLLLKIQKRLLKSKQQQKNMQLVQIFIFFIYLFREYSYEYYRYQFEFPCILKFYFSIFSPWIRIRILNADPVPVGKINADSCGSESRALVFPVGWKKFDKISQ